MVQDLIIIIIIFFLFFSTIYFVEETHLKSTFTRHFEMIQTDSQNENLHILVIELKQTSYLCRKLQFIFLVTVPKYYYSVLVVQVWNHFEAILHDV